MSCVIVISKTQRHDTTTPQYNFKNKNMKKILFLVISIIISGNISAQKLDWQERRKAADKVDVLIENYINTCKFSELGTSEYSTEQVEAFKALFAEDAKIIDTLTVQPTEDGSSEIVELSANEYAQALMARFPKGMTINIAKLQADYTQLDQGKVRVAMERKFRARDENNERITNTSNIMLHLTVNEDLDVVKITKFDTGPIKPPPPEEPEAYNDKMTLDLEGGDEDKSEDLFRNDKNIDKYCVYKLISDPKYGNVILSDRGRATYTPKNPNTEETADKFEYEVCNKDKQCSKAIVEVKIIPKEQIGSQYRGLHLSPSIAFGASTNNANVMWGYETLPGTSIVEDIRGVGGTAIGAGLELDYYFSDYIGIGTGLQYNRVSGGFGIDDFQVKYATVDNAEYERTVTMSNTTEDYTMSNIGIPLLLKFRTYPERKFGIFAQAGILFNLSASATSELSSTVDYEAGRYSMDDGETNNYTSPVLIGDDKYTLYQTIDSYDNHGTRDAINQHFNALCNQGFDVGIDMSTTNSDTSTDVGSHLNLLGRVGLLYNFSENNALQIGLQYTSGTLNADDNYQITGDVTCGDEMTNAHVEYNTLLRGGSTYSVFGLNVGLSMRLGSKKNRM